MNAITVFSIGVFVGFYVGIIVMIFILGVNWNEPAKKDEHVCNVD